MTEDRFDAELIQRITETFDKLNWDRDSRNRNGEIIFDEYCAMLRLLRSEQRELILALTEDFFYCNSITKYYPLLATALSHIGDEKVKIAQEVFVLPLITPGDIGEAKSSIEMLYSCANEIIPRILQWKLKTRAYADPRLIKKKNQDRQNALVLLIDDFIGSGTTAQKAFDFYSNALKVESDIPVVVSLIGQEKAIKELKNSGIEVVTALTRRRGISDSERIQDIQSAIRVMEDIEDRLDITAFLRFGFGRTEALVALVKTPDNTFPVFWCGNRVEGHPWPAPFYREL